MQGLLHIFKESVTLSLKFDVCIGPHLCGTPNRIMSVCPFICSLSCHLWQSFLRSVNYFFSEIWLNVSQEWLKRKRPIFKEKLFFNRTGASVKVGQNDHLNRFIYFFSFLLHVDRRPSVLRISVYRFSIKSFAYPDNKAKGGDQNESIKGPVDFSNFYIRSSWFFRR